MKQEIDVGAVVASMSETEVRLTLADMIRAMGILMDAVRNDAPLPREGRSAVDLTIETLALKDREIAHYRSGLAARDVQHARDRAEIERLEKLRAEMQGELARWMPVIEAAKEWRRDVDLHTLDANCQAGDHDDCPSRLSMPRLGAAIDTALAEKESDRE